MREVLPEGEVVEHVERGFESFRHEMSAEMSGAGARSTEAPSIGATGIEDGAILYALTRALRPSLVIETGTASGVSSLFFLAALERNRHGRLLSIDLPFRQSGANAVPLVQGSEPNEGVTPIPPGRETGWIVPESLRGRWELRLGDARELLPAAVEEEAPQLFFHDSLHTREHMLFEYETIWPRLAAGSVIASDDVFAGHDAIASFASNVGRPFATFIRLGFIRK